MRWYKSDDVLDEDKARVDRNATGDILPKKPNGRVERGWCKVDPTQEQYTFMPSIMSSP
jgi:hypothetical protein